MKLAYKRGWEEGTETSDMYVMLSGGQPPTAPNSPQQPGVFVMVGNQRHGQPVRFESQLYVCTSNTPLSTELIIPREADRFRERNIFHGCFERFGAERSVLVIKHRIHTGK
jgi:hypothetical protein